ncbi:MAG: thioredoxin family protein [archaeon]|nr:thioredoxin family protein [archaeon]
MVNVEVFVQKDCGFCTDAEEKIKKLQKSGELKCPIKFIDLDKNFKLFDKRKISGTPTILIDGKEVSLDEMIRKCKN